MAPAWSARSRMGQPRETAPITRSAGTRTDSSRERGQPRRGVEARHRLPGHAAVAGLHHDERDPVMTGPRARAGRRQHQIRQRAPRRPCHLAVQDDVVHRPPARAAEFRPAAGVPRIPSAPPSRGSRPSRSRAAIAGAAPGFRPPARPAASRRSRRGGRARAPCRSLPAAARDRGTRRPRPPLSSATSTEVHPRSASPCHAPRSKPVSVAITWRSRLAGR